MKINVFVESVVLNQNKSPCLKTGEVAIRKYVYSAKVVKLKSFLSMKEMLSKVIWESVQKAVASYQINNFY